MDGQEQAAGVQRRRSQSEVAQVVAEYEASGLSRVEFCRRKGLSLATLARYRKRLAQARTAEGNGWLAVELSRGVPALEVGGNSGLAVALTGGRRIEIGRGFDARTLAQLLGVLERI
jgi:hypothetical protein